ncbi:MAG: NYN domain-containing protein [Acidobacteriota bacterium]
MTRDERLRIAVFIDFDNIEIGVKNTLNASFDAGLVLEALKERGEVVSKTAYSDWQRAGNYSRNLTQHAIKMVQRNLTPGGDKNGADINLALDALEMAFTHPHINAFVIVGGDSDFISLVEKLKQYDKKVFVVGGRQFTSVIMQRNCHEFIAYENLLAASGGSRRPAERGVRVERVPIEQAIPLVTRGLKVLADREVSPQLGLLKSTLLQLDSTFSERSYGAGSFRDFVEKLEKIGVVKLQEVKGSLLVTLVDDERADSVATGDEGEAVEATPAASANGAGPRDRDANGDNGRPRSAAPAIVGTHAEGIREFRRILATGEVRRWPMYLRNVKQLIRQVNADFDERAYGFANLVDLLRAAARENILRVDRDRQGVVRVFQGTVPLEAPPKKIFDIEDELAEEAARAAADGNVEAADASAAGAGGGSDDDDTDAAADAAAAREADEAAADAATDADDADAAEAAKVAEAAGADADVDVEVNEDATEAAAGPRSAEAVEAPPAAASLDFDEEEDEINYNRPGAGGEDSDLAPARARRAAGRRTGGAATRTSTGRSASGRSASTRTSSGRSSTTSRAKTTRASKTTGARKSTRSPKKQ